MICISYHGSLNHDMNLYHDIDKSDEIITIARSWEAKLHAITLIIKCKMSENLLGKSVTMVLFINRLFY